MIYTTNDNPYNRSILESILGKPINLFDELAYIKVDIEEGIWYNTPAFMWLYKDPPNITKIDKIIRLCKLNAIKND